MNKILNNRKGVAVILFVLAIFHLPNAIYPSNAHAGGFFASNIFVQAMPSEFQALIVFDGKKETLFDTVTFNINPVIAWNFAYIIAVPAKPTVEPVIDDQLVKLEKLTDKKLTKESFLDRLLYFDVEEIKNVPENVYARSIDFVRYEVLGPDKSPEDIAEYLAYYGYIIPKDGKRLIEEYHQKKWYFIIAEPNVNHLQYEAKESLTVPGARTYPLKIEFETDKIIYPLRLAKVQPDFDSENVTLNYEYGSSSEQVLGIKDQKVDDMLTAQSKNKYPRIPYEYGYQKIELFVISNKKVESDQLSTFFASPITRSDFDFSDVKGDKYFELPQDKMYLTGVFGFKPTIQLEDMEFQNAPNSRLVNTKPNTNLQYFKMLLIALVPIILIILKRRLNSKKDE